MKQLISTAATACLLAAAASNVLAANYRVDIGGGYVRGDLDGSIGYNIDPGYTPPTTGNPDPTPPTGTPPTGTPPATGAPPTEPLSYGDDDYDGFLVSGDVFFNEVDTSKGPLLIAPFMSRASSIGGAYARLDTDDTDVETTLWQIDARLVTSSGWVFEGAYGNREVEIAGGDADADLIAFSVGRYLAEYTEVSAGFSREDDDAFELDRYLVTINHVQQLENGHTLSFNVEAAWVDVDTGFGGDDGWDLFLEATWFPRDNLAFGLDLEFSDRDETGDYNSYELYANYFITEKISLNLSYRQAELYGGIDAEQDSVTFEARYRF